MKKKLLVFALTICILISFIACGETKEPVITDASESNSTTYSTSEETGSATETAATETAATETTAPEATAATEATETTAATEATAATETTATEATETETTATEEPPLPFDYSNNTFPNIRDMVTKLKNGEVKPYGDFADETWLDVDLDRIYELTNLPDGYYDGLVEWSGKNSYMIYYRSVDYVPEDLKTGDHLDICFEPLENKEQLDMYKRSWASLASLREEAELYEVYNNVRVEIEETEIGTHKLYTFDYDKANLKDLQFEYLTAYDENGDLLYQCYKRVYPHKPFSINCVFYYGGEIPYAIIHEGNHSLETLLSLTPVKVEVDG